MQPPDHKDTIKQKYLKNKGLMVFIAFISAFIPFSIDLYLPALPGMAAYFNSPVKYINMTLIMFLLFFAVSSLFWGPLSDKYGRKPVLQLGLIIYIISSVMCAFSGNIFQLIAFRIVQAIGAGASTAVATAIVKDVYSGQKREPVLATVQTLVIIAPVVAPIFGAFLLNFTSWRGTFWALSGIGGIAMVLSFLFEETLRKPHTGTILHTIGRLAVVIKNPGFTFLLLIFSTAIIPLMAFVGASSYIYIEGFGLSEQAYSYFFALNALCAMFGPILYIMLSKRFKRGSLITTCFSIIAVCGCFLYYLGNISPWMFALILIPSTMSFTLLRPPSANLMLEQQQGDTGSASSLITFFSLLMGSIGISLISLQWDNVIMVMGVLQIVTGIACGSLWLIISKKSFIIQIADRNKTT
jgi:DHA1 family bicyclomycin/chloramphenicol resistance-like MFS transporter